MHDELTEACKYESFNTLIKINDPELLLDAFASQLAPGHEQSLLVEIYELVDRKWKRLSGLGDNIGDVNLDRMEILHSKIHPEQTMHWFYEASQDGWFCAYKPITSRQFALFIATNSPQSLIDESYIQLLFSFYCHQLHSLEGTYRDSLTGLYNRKAFDLRMENLLNKPNYLYRRKNTSHPSIFAMLDIDHFKSINDGFGHLYGDEVLAIVARLMIDSFREYDLLFRYGGEEFSAVLMDLNVDSCLQVMERFRCKVETYSFPRNNPVTVSIGFTEFDSSASSQQMIELADKALYKAKNNGRNQIQSL